MNQKADLVSTARSSYDPSNKANISGIFLRGEKEK